MNDVANSPPAAVVSPEIERQSDIARADLVLRGAQLAPQDTFDLAEKLRKWNEFGRARRLYGRVWAVNTCSSLKVTAVKIGQRYALATYKDPDLPAAERFRRALDILEKVDNLDLAAPAPSKARLGALRSERLAVEQGQESLGLRGAVYKRRWQIEGQRIDLERAFGFYFKGYELGRAFPANQLGVETDQGYTGINAAYALNLLAMEEANQARFAKIEPILARQRYDQARDIRTFLVDKLTLLKKEPDFAWALKEWWFHATLAEAQLGLGDVDAAIASLREYNTAHGLSHQGPPLEKISRWEFESTLGQLASLADMYAELERLVNPAGAGGDAWASHWRSGFRDYLGELEPAMERVEMGKVGLALSGGGLRASLFHIGVFAYLAERDMLRRVEVLSCVSGGSIAGAHLYLEVKQLLKHKSDNEVGTQDYCDIVERMRLAFEAGVQTNIRCQVFASIWSNLRALFQPGYTTTRRLGELYESVLYSRVDDNQDGKPRYLPELMFVPKGELPTEFKPKYDNWRRRAKVPLLVLNATTLNTGHNWQFTGSFMGEPPVSIDAEIEGNYRLRRMYYDEAPRLRDRWTKWYSRPFAPPDYRQMRLGDAVAASSCVPGLFEPITLPDLYDRKLVRLVDGGVYDNQGVASLFEQDCNVLIVSDASGQMGTLDHPAASRLGISLRSFSVSMTRVRQAQYRELAARDRAGLVKRFVFLHLKRDLDADPVDWRECQNPFAAECEAIPAAKRGVLTGYRLQKSVQRLLSVLRTDLDSFTELEASALMTSGYRQAESQFALRTDWPEAVEVKPWSFLSVEKLLRPGPHFEEVTRLLRIGGFTGFKAWFVAPVLGVGGVLVLVGALLGVAYAWWSHRTLPLLTLGELGTALFVFAATLLVPQLVAIARYRQTVRAFGVKSLIGLALALVFKFHLRTFDRLFLARGKLSRFEK